MNYVFHTTCEDSYCVGDHGEDINEMTSSPHMVDIDSESFINQLAKTVGIQDQLLDMFNLDNTEEFASDWGISVHKSHFQGLDSLYVRHSGIEHIFVREDQTSSILRGEEAESRRDTIDALDTLLEDDDSWDKVYKSESPKDKYTALSKFVADNESTFKDNHILLASLFAYGHNYGDIVKKVDHNQLMDQSPETNLDINF